MLGHMIGRLRDDLAKRKLKVPAFENGEESAIRAFTELRFRKVFAEWGRPYGLSYAEKYHYIGSDDALGPDLARQAVPL